MNENFKTLLLDAILLSFPISVVFLITPVNIYLSNQPEFQYEFQILSIFLIIYIVSLIFAMVFLKMTSKEISKKIVSLFFFTGLYIHLSILIVPVQVGELVGKNELDIIAEPFMLSMIEVLLGIGVLFLAIKSPWEKVRKAGSIYSMCVLVVAAGYFFLKIEFPERKTPTQRESIAQSGFTGPNIYHFIFDAFDGILFDGIIDNLNSREKFRGFTFYRNNICNYGTTSLSVPSLMTGKFLDGEIEVKDFNFLSEGLIKSLKEYGYRISQYDMYSSSHMLTDYWVSPATIEPDLNRKMNMLKLADLSVLVAAPNFLQTESFQKGKGLVSRLIYSKKTLSNWQDRDPEVSLLMIDKLISDELFRSSSGEYVFAHVMIPHPPYVFDQNCNFIGKQNSDKKTVKGKQNLKNQNYCVVNQMVKILDCLKREEKYNSSIIIIQSDHGELNRYIPLLLVKKPNSSEDSLEISEHFTQLLDIAPTILDGAGLEKNNMSGLSLFSSDLSESRDFPFGMALSKTKEIPYYTVRDGRFIKNSEPIIRTDIR